MDDLTARLLPLVVAFEGFQPSPDGPDHQEHLLERLVDVATHALPDASAASVTVLQDEGLPARTAAATQRVVVAIDLEQYTSGGGPCLEAARERHPVRGRIEDARGRWPAFAESAAKSGVHSYLSAPLLLDDGPIRGSLNLYSGEPGGFEALDELLTTFMVSAASAVLVNLGRYGRARTRAEELTLALTSRAEIDQAKGILMAQHGVPADQAFAMLVERSQSSNTKLRDVAHELCASVSARAGLD